jgi:hypothetical protein
MTELEAEIQSLVRECFSHPWQQVALDAEDDLVVVLLPTGAPLPSEIPKKAYEISYIKA